MKKRSNILLVLCLVVKVAYAQIRIKEAGTFLGGALSDIGNSDLVGHGVKACYLYGIYGQANFTDEAFLRLETGAVSKGFNTGGNKHIINYITLPVMLGYDIGSNVDLLFGTELAWLQQYQGNLVIRPSGFDIGLAAGVRYHANRVLSFELRFTHSIRNMFTFDYFDIAGNKMGTEKFGLNQYLQFTCYQNLLGLKPQRKAN